ncbi:hypothetical protein [[Eubacterium] cellulosolvens]
MKNKITSPFAILILFTILCSFPIVEADVNGQCYASKSIYQYGDIVVVYISTSTGINNTRLVIHLPGGQINTYNIGKIGIGIWQFPLGSASGPEGQRVIVLMDSSNELDTATYFVFRYYPSPATTTSYNTITRYRTTTTYETSTRFITTSKITTRYETSTIHTTEYSTKTSTTSLIHHIIQNYTTTFPTTITLFSTSFISEIEIHTTLSTLTVQFPIPIEQNYVYLIVIILLVIALIAALTKINRK